MIKKLKESPVWWLRLSYILLVASICNTLFCLFGSWAVNAVPFGKYDLGSAIVFAFYFAYSFAASLVLVLPAVAGVIIGLLFNYQVRLYMIMLIASLTPVIYFDYIR